MLSIGGSTLNGSFKLVTNIDCTGQDFSAGPTTLNGNFDGGGHTISNLTIGQYGLFYIIQNGTVKDLKIQGTQGDFVGGGLGGLAVQIDTVTIDNVHVYMNFPDPGNASGGLVSISSNATITNSSYHGFITADNSGGIVGQATDTTILHSYSTGSIVGDNTGGIVGSDSATTTVSDSVSTMNLDANSPGGLVGSGSTSTIVTDSIFAGVIIPSIGGNIVGRNSLDAVVTNSYYLSTNAPAGDCVNDPSTNSTVANCYEEASGSYSDINAATALPPISGYWTKPIINSPPVLISPDTFNDSATIPNDGDANGDGTLDSYQPTVVPIAGRNDQNWVTVEISGDNACYLEDSESAWVDAHAAANDASFERVTTDMAGFSLYCRDAGGTSTITLIYDRLIDTSGAVLRQFNSSTNTYSTISGASFGTRSVGGNTVTTVTYSITDGGPYDIDGSANRIIVDPVGIATLISTPFASNLARTGDSNVAIQNIASIALIVSLLSIVVVSRKKIIN